MPDPIWQQIYKWWVLSKWKAGVGQRAASPHRVVKQAIIAAYQKEYGVNVLVETGTYKGDMVHAQLKNFKRIYSIEISWDLYSRAVERFMKKGHVSIVYGDSGYLLPEIIAEIDEPAIFWLDGHYSSGITSMGETECPVVKEIDAIFESKNSGHIILVDDAMYFNGQGDYPSVDELTRRIVSKNPRYRVEVKDDIIRYVVA